MLNKVFQHTASIRHRLTGVTPTGIVPFSHRPKFLMK